MYKYNFYPTLKNEVLKTIISEKKIPGDKLQILCIIEEVKRGFKVSYQRFTIKE